jgi:hypothetical protein
MPRKGSNENTDYPVGTTRICKVDDRNFAIQQLQELTRTANPRKEWVDLGYTSDNWKHLTNMCLIHGVPDGPLKVEVLEQCAKDIARACKEALA